MIDERKKKVFSAFIPKIAVHLCISAGLFWIIWIFGHRQFGAYDYSTLIDVAWRLYIGQQPYRDFYLTLPVGFYLGALSAYKIWGVRWTAFVVSAAIISVISFNAHVFLMKRLFSWRQAVGLALTCQLLSMVIASYWWYNTITVVAVCLFITAAFVFLRAPKEYSSSILFCSSLVFLMFMKPNMAGIAIISVTLALLFSKDCRNKALIFLAASGLFTVIIMISVGINPMDAIKSYLSVGKSRALPTLKLFFTDKPQEALISLPLIVMIFIPIASFINQFKLSFFDLIQHPIFLLSFAGIITAIIGFVTNYESNIIGLSPMLISSFLPSLILIEEGTLKNKADKNLFFSCIAAIIALLIGIPLCHYWLEKGFLFIKTKPMATFFLIVWFVSMFLALLAIALTFFDCAKFFEIAPRLQRVDKKPFDNRQSMLALCNVVLIICSLTAIYVGGLRWRVMGIGPFFDNRHKLITIDSPSFFKNFYLSPQAISVIQQIGLAIKPDSQHLRNNKSIFFGPRLEFAYAVFSIASPKGMPIWWHPGSSYPEEKTKDIINKFKEHQFDRCIFLKDISSGKPDFTRFPDEIIEELGHSYNRIDYKDIILFEKVKR